MGLWGLSLLAVDGVLLCVGEGAQQNQVLTLISSHTEDGRCMIDPPDWLGYTLVGMGGLTMLYSVALPKG